MKFVVQAESYSQQIPANDNFFISCPDFLVELHRHGLTAVELSDADEQAEAGSVSNDLTFTSLDAFRPLAERAPEPQIAEMHRREFFRQFHRWLRQEYNVYVFCNNDGERQRFEEVWKELDSLTTTGRTSRWARWPVDSFARTEMVVVTDAEIFGRYKVLRPRRLKSPHATAVRSAMEIDFADLELGDLVVHLQHGIGRYLGLKNLPVGAGGRHGPAARLPRKRSASSSNMPLLTPAKSRQNCTSPSARRIWSANTSALARPIRRSSRRRSE